MENLVIDNNWLTTALSIAASAYIFLLGVPTIIFQTYMPEELREIYIKRKETRKSLDSLKSLGFFLIGIIFVVTFGNIFLPLICYTEHSKPPKNIDQFCDDYGIFLCYYLLVFILFLLFAFKMYQYINKQINNGNVRKQIIKAVIIEATEYFNEHGKIRREDIQDLQVMGKSFSPGLKKKELLQELMSFSRYIIQSGSYTGDELNELIDDVLIEAFCYNGDTSSRSNISAILEICKQIPNDPLQDMSYVDRSSMSRLVDRITHIAIEKNDKSLFFQSFELLKKLPNTDDMVFEICKKNYKYERYDLVQQKIIYLAKSFKHMPIENINHNKVRHMLCYLSWFFSGHEHMKHFTEEKIKELIAARILSNQILTDAIAFFQNKADYDSAHYINHLRTHFFSN